MILLYYGYLLASQELFDVVILDLPDPRSVSLARLYSRPFYALAARHLAPGGVLVLLAIASLVGVRLCRETAFEDQS